MRRLLILATLLLAASPAFAKLPVKTITLSDKTKTDETTVRYPQTGNKAVDAEIANWAKSLTSDFRSEAKDDAPGDGRPYYLDISYEVARNDDKVFAVVFTEEIDQGGAHPNHDFITFNFLMPDGWRIYLPEIFTRDGLKKISAFATADMNKQLAGPDGMSDTDWIKGGAGPDWGNFKDFTLLPKELDIQFPPYQVAAYAAGPQETHVPLSLLANSYRANWRAPVASFDCDQAKTPVERAICSDVALARLDREEAETYASNLGFQDNVKTKDAMRDRQRAWLKSRDTVCGGKAGADQVACLTTLYKKRIATPQGEL